MAVTINKLDLRHVNESFDLMLKLRKMGVYVSAF